MQTCTSRDSTERYVGDAEKEEGVTAKESWGGGEQPAGGFPYGTGCQEQ